MDPASCSTRRTPEGRQHRTPDFLALSHTESVWAVVVTPDGRRTVSVSNDHTLRLWDLESGDEIATFTGESGMHSCAVTSDGRRIVVGDALGRVHFLRLVEADETKLLPGEI